VSKARAVALERVLGPLGPEARVGWVGLSPLVASGDAGEGACDAVVVGPAAGELGPVFAAARARVRPGGVVAALLPIEGTGWGVAVQRALSLFSAARRPRALEEVCGALLCAGHAPVKVERIGGLRAEALVYGVVRAP